MYTLYKIINDPCSHAQLMAARQKLVSAHVSCLEQSIYIYVCVFIFKIITYLLSTYSSLTIKTIIPSQYWLYYFY